MKKTVVHALFTALLGVMLVAGVAWAGPDEDAISNLMNKELAAGWKNNSPGQVMQIYAAEEPIVWIDVDKDAKLALTTSKEDRKKALEELFSRIKVVEYVVDDISVTKVSDNIALVSTTEKLTFTSKNGKKEDQMIFRNLYEVIRQKDGKWRAHREISVVANAAD